jgi:hypothetical protein
MTTAQHVRRLGLLMFAVSVLLTWLIAHTDVFFADGLRYIAQAKTIDRGSWTQGLVRSVDHPIYPMAIAAAHRVLGGNGPHDWQTAAQVASAISGVLLVIPIYLVSVEVIGPSSAWLACFLIYLLPFTGHVLADTLSESTFLLFWTWGLWSTLRFLRAGGLLWVPLLIAFSVLAYLTRPEGLILPVALLATLIVLSMFRSEEMPRAKRLWTIGVLVVGPVLMAGPFMMMKGGISTKPSILRILGFGRAAPAMAVERERPLDPEQSMAKTVALAARAMIRAVDGATSLPLLLLAPFGIAASLSSSVSRRYWLLLGTIVALSTLAMIRLHAMSGYCTPRHAMVVAWILIPASAAGLNRLAGILTQAITKLAGNKASWPGLEPAIMLVSLGGCLVLWGPAAIASVDPGFHGYRQAGEWLASVAIPGEGVVDPKGFSLFYADKPGYTFATLVRGVHDPSVRWVVAHEALVFGPWDYSMAIRTLVANRRPIRIFPAKPAHRVSKVYLYDLAQPVERTAGVADPPSQSRR